MPDMSSKKITTGVIFTLALSGLLFLSPKFPFGDSDQNEADYPIKRIMQYGFSLQNTSNKLLPEVEFLTYAPVKKTSSQKVLGLQVSQQYELIEDKQGNQILRFKFYDFPPYASKIISVKAEIGLSEQPLRFQEKNKSIYLKPEKFVESDNEEIKALSTSLVADTVFGTAEKIFKWVSENIKYKGYSGKEQGALYAYNNKKGDCTEYMDLFVAVLRANNIPARRIGGYVIKQNAIVEPSDFHNWAEFYDGATWQMADPQEKVFAQNRAEYVALHIINTGSENTLPSIERYKVNSKNVRVQLTI